MRRLLSLWLALLCLTLVLPAGARAAPAPGGCAARPVDLMLVLDDSGSMAASDEQNDPDNLRITAAHLLVDLLDPTDRVGLVLFSDSLRAVSPLTPVGSGGAGLHQVINRFESRGGTRLDQALQAGLDGLGAAADRTRALLLLTDGKPDTDPQGQAARMAALATKAGESGVELYVIGLGPGYDRALLEQLTTLSRSRQLWHVVQPDHLSTAFLEILRNLKGLNIETSTAGQVPVLGLSPEVRFAALRPRGEAAAQVTWPGGTAQEQYTAVEMPSTVRYSYDLLVYKPAAAGPGEARSGARVLWKIERPPVAAAVVAPGARESVASGEPLPVKVALSPCGGAAVPAGLKGTVTLLNADRKPMPYQTDLVADAAGNLVGNLPMPPEEGTYVLDVRVLTAEGRQVTVAEQTVQASPQSRWVLDAPGALAQGAEASIRVRHRFGGKPAPGGLEALSANLPNGNAVILGLTESGTGEWMARFTAPPDQLGDITWILGGGKATASTRVEPVRFVLKDPGPVTWSFADAWRGRPATFSLTGETTGPVAGAAVLPPMTASGFSQGPWQGPGAQAAPGPGTGPYSASATWQLTEPITWRTLPRDLFLGRNLTASLTPAAGPYIAADAVSVTARMTPLLPIGRVVWALLLAGLAIWLIHRRLFAGPQLPIAVAVGAGGLVLLNQRRPGLWTRFINPRAQKEITVGGLQSKAAVKLAELPPDALLRITSRGVPGRERFRLENQNRAYPLVFKDLYQRNRIALKGRGPAPLIALGGVPLKLLLHPGSKHRR